MTSETTKKTRPPFMDELAAEEAEATHVFAAHHEDAAGVQLTPVESLCKQASAFYAAATQVYLQELDMAGFNPYCVAPFLVNSALTAELYLKALALAHHQKASTVRGLLKLYDSLPLSAKIDIEGAVALHADKYTLKHPIVFRNYLDNLNSAHVVWRYMHEKERLAGIDIAHIMFIMEVLVGACQRHTAELR